jgi:hypothetical protein
MLAYHPEKLKKQRTKDVFCEVITNLSKLGVKHQKKRELEHTL